MKTKFVYVLTSSGKGYYYEQCLVSCYSLRFHNPDAHIVLVVDDITNSTLVGQREELKRIVSETIVLSLPQEYNMMQRSRYMKTDLRNIISGDFLFIDTDTVICGNLADIDSFSYEMGAVYDSHIIRNIEDSKYVSDNYIIENSKLLGWDSLIGCPNYNGGVLLVKDCQKSKVFYSLWHKYWLECHGKGLDIDMIALCRANKELGNIIQPLNGVWNCQVKRSCLAYLPQAKIIHYFTATDHVCYMFAKKEIQEEVKKKGLTERIKNMLQVPQSAFEDGSLVAGKEDAEFSNVTIHTLYQYYPKMFVVLETFAKKYISFRIFSGKLLKWIN